MLTGCFVLILQQLTPQRAACAGEGEVGKLLIVQRVAQDEDVRHKEDGQLDRHAAGVEWAFFGTAQKHDIGQCCAGGRFSRPTYSGSQYAVCFSISAWQATQ